MADRPAISVIIPVFNGEKYLKECVDSVISQTFADIEIILVNDGSTDNSLNIMQEYNNLDKRVVIVDKKNNEGTMLARKSGVDVANGEYIVFLDSDDYIAENLCEFIKSETDKDPVDILHFSMGVIGTTSGINAQGFISNMKPLADKIYGDEVIKAAYIERKFTSQLCGKAVKAKICKKACSLLPKEKCHVGEDVFTFFVVALFAESYKGIVTPYYYMYRFGAGVSNLRTMSLDKFKLFCKMSNWYRYAEKILSQINANEVQIQAAKSMASRFFDDCSEMYAIRVKYDDKADATDLMAKYWSDTPVQDSAWPKFTRKNKDYFIQQSKIDEYVKSSDLKNIPDISVIVTVDNNQETIGNTIKHLTENHSENIEIICVNNGSADNSLDIINSYADNDDRITVINRKNRGVSAAKNIGLKYASGKYIIFVDADKNMEISYIKEMYDAAIINNAEIVVAANIENTVNVFNGEETLELLLNNNCFSCNLSNMLISRRYLVDTEIKFNTSLRLGNILFVPLIMILASKVVFVNKSTESWVESGNPLHNKAEEFIEYFYVYNTLSANAILSDRYSENAKALLTMISKYYYSISNDIYMNLSLSECRIIDRDLPNEFKPLFFNTRELKNVKQSLAYRVGDKLTRLPRNILDNLKSKK